MADGAARHDQARRVHESAAERHERAAQFWEDRGDPERAELDWRNVAIERAAAELEADRAQLEAERPLEPGASVGTSRPTSDDGRQQPGDQ